MTRDSTQTGITFDVDGLYETLGEEREVDTEATGEVHEDTVNTTAVASAHNSLLVACRLLAGTLLHIQVRRIDDAGCFSPRRQLVPCRLPSFYLVQGQRDIDLRVLTGRESKTTHIIVAVQPDKILCGDVNL